MKYHENIEKIFSDEIRDKKRTGRGAFSMRGKGVKHGFSGALRTPYHFMTNKEKQNLNGEVEVSNMFTTILNWTEFQMKDDETKRNLLTKWRDIYPNDKIREELSIGRDKPISHTFLNKLVQELGVPKKPRGGNVRTKSKRKANTSQTIQPNSPVVDFEPPKKKEEPEQQIKQMLITQGLHLEYNGKYDVETLNKLFTKLQLLIDGDSNKYHISLSLSEIVED